MNEISEFLRDRIEAGDFPSAVCLVAERGRTVLHEAHGLAVVEPERIEATPETIYDLASLTKPLVTGLLCALLIETGELDPEAPVGRYLEGFETEPKSRITVRSLLTHTSGLPAWLPFYLVAGSPDRVLETISSTPLGDPVNKKVVYSDLNFLLAGSLIERLRGGRLDEIARAEIFGPLGLERTFFNPPPELRRRIAASERGNAYERRTCLDLGIRSGEIPPGAFREGVIWGEVHDNNCHFMGGVAGHAGLFSNARETLLIARQFLPAATELLRPETCGLFRRNLTPGLEQARSLSFQLAATPGSTAGPALAPDSFGHLGFTGTSLWIDPAAERIYILLTNRTHGRELPLADLAATRTGFHRLAAEMLVRKGGNGVS